MGSRFVFILTRTQEIGGPKAMDTGVASYRNNSATAIWSRFIEPDHGNLTPDAARAWLRLAFPEEDHKRGDELNKKAQQGTLTQDEDEEIDDYIRVSDELAIIKAKARLSLKESGLRCLTPSMRTVSSRLHYIRSSSAPRCL